MLKLPEIIVSTVVRVSTHGEAHGYIYKVDLESGAYRKVYELKRTDISWKGRGGDRGFRGIAQYNELFYIPIGTELCIFNREFKLQRVFSNYYLKDIHEVVVWQDKLYLLSTIFDSVLEFDLKRNVFNKGFLIRRKDGKRYIPKKLDAYLIYWFPDFIYYKLYPYVHADLKRKDLLIETFDPNSQSGPIENDTLHLNSISVFRNKLCISGSHTPRIFLFDEKGFVDGPRIPHKTHNAQFFKDNMLIYNHTIRNKLVINDLESNRHICMPVPTYLNEAEIVNNPNDDKLAAIGFARGMAFFKDLIIIGSSPATVTIYCNKTFQLVKQIILSNDARNSVHGISIISK